MDHAVQLLADPNAHIATVARQVGYDDPYYFSRAFKRHFGVAPANFRQYVHRRVLALGRSLFGDLLALGIRSPHAQVIDTEAQGPFHRVAPETVSRETVSGTAPDVIIAPPSDLLHGLADIAPTYAVNGTELGWRHQFRTFAGHLHMETVAAVWLQRYEHRTALVRASLRAEFPGETVMVVRTRPTGFLVLGARQQIWSDLLCRDLGLVMPASLRDHSALLVRDIRELDDFGADRILVLSGALPAETSLAQVRWHQLQAAQRGAFHVVWNRTKPSYSAWFAEWLTDYTVNALLSSPLDPA